MDLKLIDFGYAENKDIYQLTSFCGTESYMAPEILEREIYNGKHIDIFSLGITIFQIVSGKLPFEEAT